MANKIPHGNNSMLYSERILANGIDFHTAYIEMMEKQSPSTAWTIALLNPALVCGSFAAECYLKALYVYEAGEAPPREHDLVKLFGRLPLKARQRIAALYCSPVESGHLLGDLYAITNAFTQMRYMFENDYHHIRPPILEHVLITLLTAWIRNKPPRVGIAAPEAIFERLNVRPDGDT